MVVGDFTGRQLGDFVVHEPIGKGGMAVVYRATQTSVNRDVALKVIPLKDAERQDDLFQSRFKKEARLIASLEHIHILPIYDYGFTGDAAYLAMRLLRGGTLSDRLRLGPLPSEEAARLFRQFCSGLAYAHRKGVIHRDLKPGNIMLDDDGNVLLADFGLAKLIGDSLDITQPGSIVGTPAYMSPEQLRGQVLDPRTDIYSAGVVLYQMMTGREPFGGPTSDLVTTIYRQLEETPTSPRSINPAIVPEAENVILRAMRKSPGDRFESIEDMSHALDQALGLRGSSANLSAAHVQDAAHTGESDTIEPPPLALESGPQTVGIYRLRYYLLGGVSVMALMAAVFGLLLASTGSGDSDSEHGSWVPTVLTGETGTTGQAVPTDDEIARARQRLGEKGFIAYVTCTLKTDYHATQAREMGDFAAHYGLAYRIYDSNTDEYQQLTLIQKALAEGARGLIVCPLNTTLLDASMKSAQQGGIALVFLQSNMPSYGGVLVAGDEYEMGLKAGRFAGQIIAHEMGGRADVIILDYPDLTTLVLRANGLEDGMKEYAPAARVIGRYKGGTREFGMASVGKLLDAGTHFDVILSINDAGALGAISAMEKADIPPDQVVISSVDAEELAKAYIRKDYFIRGSVAVDRQQFSHAAVDAMVKLLAGSTLPETLLVPPGGVVTRQVLQAGSP